MMGEMWRIRARVWGGVTGSRTAYVKFAGKEWSGTEEEARRIAADLTSQTMGNPHRTANFEYTPEPCH